MVMARNLEVAHQIDGDVKTTKVLVEDNVKRIEAVARSVDNGMQQLEHNADVNAGSER